MEEIKYEFRKIKAEDIFIMTKIISIIGVDKFSECFRNEEVQNLITDLKNKKNKNMNLIVGGEVFLSIAQVVLEGLDKCKDNIYKLLSNTSNLTVEQIKELDGVTFLNMVVDFIKKEEFADFIKVASKFVK